MKLDHLDYGRMAALIESHTPCPGHEGRADFMNALAEGLCELAYDRWKPAPHLRVAWSAPPIPGGTSHG